MRSVVAALICLVACSKDDHVGGAFASIEDRASAYQAAVCKRLVACGDFPDAATCEATNIGGNPIALDPGVLDASIVSAVLAGTVIYDGTKMQQCFDAIGAENCDRSAQDTRTTPEICFGVLRGTVAAGGACHLDAECTSRACSRPSCDDGCCAGTCLGDLAVPHAFAAVGETCTGSVEQECVTGSFCDPSTLICSPLLSEGSTCTQVYQCEYGTLCAGVIQMDGEVLLTCRVLPTLGQACTTVLCRDEGTLCEPMARPGVPGTCTAAGTATDACPPSMDCSNYYRCDMQTQSCIPNPAIGESCEIYRCMDLDAYCDPVTSLCTPVVADGLPCTADAGCTSGTCDPSGLCIEPTTCI